MTKELDLEVKVTEIDAFAALADLTARAIMTHPNHEKYERALFEICGAEVHATES